MYEKNLLKVTTPPCDELHDDGECDNCWDDKHVHQIFDNRKKSDELWKAGAVYLPHSCEEWVIGGKEEVELMIQDLQNILKTL